MFSWWWGNASNSDNSIIMEYHLNHTSVLVIAIIQEGKFHISIHVIPPSSSDRLQEMSGKICLKCTTFSQKFRISLKWTKNFPICIFYTFFKNLPEMKEKSPWCPFPTHHMYAFQSLPILLLFYCLQNSIFYELIKFLLYIQRSQRSS